MLSLHYRERPTRKCDSISRRLVETGFRIFPIFVPVANVFSICSLARLVPTGLHESGRDVREHQVGRYSLLDVPGEFETDTLPVQRSILYLHLRQRIRRVFDAYQPRREMYRRKQIASQVSSLSGYRAKRE